MIVLNKNSGAHIHLMTIKLQIQAKLLSYSFERVVLELLEYSPCKEN